MFVLCCVCVRVMRNVSECVRVLEKESVVCVCEIGDVCFRE